MDKLVVMKILLICRSSRPQVFLKILQNSQKTSAPESFLNEVVGWRPQTYNFTKKETLEQVQICKILKNTFLQNSCGRLLLDISEY